jgi:hypothetical protein
MISAVSATQLLADNVTKVPVNFQEGRETVVIPGEVKGHDSVVYSLPAKEGQFLTVNLRANNRNTDFNIYIPRRNPGDEALYASALGGKLDYLGQLYKNGEHQISVFLNRAAAREGKDSKFDIAFRLTNGKPADSVIPVDGEDPVTVHSDPPMPNKAVLLERQSKLPASLQKSPEAIVHAVLAPSIYGQAHQTKSEYDSVEGASEVTVTVEEGAILDDDLLGVIHTVNLLKNKNGEWRIVGYSYKEKRR